jgi:hypothetical protein
MYSFFPVGNPVLMTGKLSAWPGTYHAICGILIVISTNRDKEFSTYGEPDLQIRQKIFCRSASHIPIFPGSSRAQTAIASQSRKSPTGDFAFLVIHFSNHESFTGSSLPANTVSATGCSGARDA